MHSLKHTLEAKLKSCLCTHFLTHPSITLSDLRQIITQSTTEEERRQSHTEQHTVNELFTRPALGVLTHEQRKLTLTQLLQELSSNTPQQESKNLQKQRQTAHSSIHLHPLILNEEKASKVQRRVVRYRGNLVLLSELEKVAAAEQCDIVSIRKIIMNKISVAGILSKEILLQVMNIYIDNETKELASKLGISLGHIVKKEQYPILDGHQKFNDQEILGEYDLTTVNAQDWSLLELEDRLNNYPLEYDTKDIYNLCTKTTAPLFKLQDRLKYKQKKHVKQNGVPSTPEAALLLLNSFLTAEDKACILDNRSTIQVKSLLDLSLQNETWSTQLILNEQAEFEIDHTQITPPKDESLAKKCYKRLYGLKRHIPAEGFTSIETFMNFLNQYITHANKKEIYDCKRDTVDYFFPKKYTLYAENLRVKKTIDKKGRDQYLFVIINTETSSLITQKTYDRISTSDAPHNKKRKIEQEQSDNKSQSASDTQQASASVSDTTASTSQRASVIISTSTPSKITHPLYQQPQPPIPTAFTTPPIDLQRSTLVVIPPHQPIPEETSAQRAARIRRERETEEAEKIYLLAHREMLIRQNFSQFYQAHPQYMPHIQPLHTEHHTQREIHNYPLGQQPIPPQSPTRQQPYQYAPWQQTSYHPSLISVVDGHIEHRHTSTQESTSQDRTQRSTPDLSLMAQEPQSSSDTIDGQQEPQEPYNPKKRILKTWKKDPKNKNNKDRDNKKDDH